MKTKIAVMVSGGGTNLQALLDAQKSGVLTAGEIVLIEGKYHQIKRMLEVLDNKITYLERISFGPLTLDTSLERGEWRYLTESEIAILENSK